MDFVVSPSWRGRKIPLSSSPRPKSVAGRGEPGRRADAAVPADSGPGASRVARNQRRCQRPGAAAAVVAACFGSAAVPHPGRAPLAAPLLPQPRQACRPRGAPPRHTLLRRVSKPGKTDACAHRVVGARTRAVHRQAAVPDRDWPGGACRGLLVPFPAVRPLLVGFVPFGATRSA